MSDNNALTREELQEAAKTFKFGAEYSDLCRTRGDDWCNAAIEERAHRLRLRKALEATLESSDELLIAMETCHICKGTIILEESPTHCEDCSWDCDEHEEPECKPIYALHSAVKKSVEMARAALRGETE